MRDREREAETQAEGEAGSTQRAQCGTQSLVSRIRPWAEGSAKPLSHPGCPVFIFYFFRDFIYFETLFVGLQKKFFLRFYLFIHKRQRERGRDTGRGRSRLPARSPMWDLIPGSPGSHPGLKVALNH